MSSVTFLPELINLRSSSQMAGDSAAAKVFFTKSLDQSKTIGMREGIMEAQAALLRLDRADHKVTKAQP